MQSSVLLIDCPDQKGLVHKITGILYQHELNLLSNDEFVEHDTNHFFMRTEFVGQAPINQIVQELTEILPSGVNIRISQKQKKDIVILVTKEHQCLAELLIRYQFNDLNANILAVIGNYENLASFTQKFGIPYHFISHEGMSREEHEKAVMQMINSYQPDFVVLAKYMRILSSDFVAHYPDRIINIHHSFLPAFIGANPYRQAYDRGVKIVGATAHFVNNHLDEGPIIVQSVIPVDHSQSASEMAQAGRDVEKIVLANALKLVFSDRVFVSRNKTIIFN